MFERLRRFMGLSTSDETQPKTKPTSEQKQTVRPAATSYGGTPVRKRDDGGSDDSVLPAYMLLSSFNTPPSNDTTPAKTSFFGGGGADFGGGGGGDGGGDGGGEITCDPSRDVILLRQRTFRM